MSDIDNKSVVKQFANKSISRRNFLVSAGVITGGISLGSVLTYLYKKYNIEPPYTNFQLDIVQNLHNHLFPSSGDSPGATDINSAEYLEFVLLDPNIDEDDRNVLKNGVLWLEEESQEMYNNSFSLLSKSEIDILLRSIEEYNWGYRYLTLNLTYIFEALLSDPIYGGNPDEIGWKWLDHIPGVPRPTENAKYKSK